MRLYISIGLLVLLVISLAAAKTNQFIKQAHTFDTFGMISVAISKTLTKEAWENGYDAVRETHLMFPRVNIDGNSIIDAWQNPIHINIYRLENSFSVRIASAGIDGKLGTSDDCVREYDFIDEPHSDPACHQPKK